MDTRQTAPSRELLLATHRFPGPYIVKAFGPGDDRFRAGIAGCATSVVGDQRVTITERATRSGHKICVTLTITAQSVDEVIEIYGHVARVPGLMLIL